MAVTRLGLYGGPRSPYGSFAGKTVTATDFTISSALYAQHSQLAVVVGIGERHRWPFALRSDFAEANDRVLFSYDHQTGRMAPAGIRWSDSVKSVSTQSTSPVTLGTITIPAVLITVGSLIRITWFASLNTTPSGTYTLGVELSGVAIDNSQYGALDTDIRGAIDALVDDADSSGSVMVKTDRIRFDTDVTADTGLSVASIDLSADVDVEIIANVSVGTDTVTIPGFHVEVLS